MSQIALQRPPFWRVVRNWAIAGGVVVVAHASVGYGVASFGFEPNSTDLGPIMTVDLAPISVSEAQPVERETLQEEQSQESPEPEQTEKLDEEDVTEDEPEVVEETPEEVAESESELVDTVATPVVEKAEVVAPKPKPKPVKKAEKPPMPRKIVKKLEPTPTIEKPVRKPKPAIKKQTSTVKTAQNAGARQTTQVGQVGAGKPSSATLQRWNSQLVTAILRRKPRGLRERGAVNIRFTVGAGGSLISALVARSSGNPTLDRAALQMVRGARLPAPPIELGRPPFTRTAPIKFE